MSNYVISCCSTADLTKEHFEKRNISYICFHYELNGKEYAVDLGQSMPFDVFYIAMQDGASTKTSQVNADEFEEYFEGFLKQGKDVLHVCLSSGISGVAYIERIDKCSFPAVAFLPSCQVMECCLTSYHIHFAFNHLL